MEEQKTKFIYYNIQLYKSESLGSGSYGGVCKAKCDGLLCAAKIMHPTLFDLRDPGTDSYLHKFQEECYLLSLARHPNVVQYLATYCDPDTRLPVLLMELCDESLTAFLERSPGPLSYHIQLNICHDIALALAYLHSNGLIHRDLSGNNVLMIAGIRAKVTDFGMCKLATINSRTTAMTLCPGNVLYMSPEALNEATSYTAKLDIFSFGVIVIQILTRLFPKPTDRFRTVYVPEFHEPLQQVIPDTERRQAHLQLISDTHSLKPLAIQCLKKEEERPSALQLSERLSELKQTHQYTESIRQAEINNEIQQLKQQLQGQRILTQAKMSEAYEHQARIKELQSVVEESQHTIEVKDRELEEKERIIQMKHFEHQQAIEAKERELQQIQEQLRLSEQLVLEFQQSIQQKDKIMSAQGERIQQLEQQHKASRDEPQLQQVTTDILLPTVVTVPAAIRQMTWREGKKAPEKMKRGAAVVHGNTAYFTPFDTRKIYSYQNIQREEQWTRLPDNPNKEFSLAVIDGLLTSVGGYKDGYTNTLLSLTGDCKRKQWSEIFPPMPTPRHNTTCITTEQAVVVAGGNAGDDILDTVEVMNSSTKLWTTVSPLPQKLVHFSGIACGDTLYLAGGYSYIGRSMSKCVFTCSLPDLLQPKTIGSRIRQAISGSKWKTVSSLPVTFSTLASLGGHLLAIGGHDDSGKPSNYVYRYDYHTNSWNVISRMKNKRSWCFGVTLPRDRLVVVGGFTTLVEETDSIEIWGNGK